MCSLRCDILAGLDQKHRVVGTFRKARGEASIFDRAFWSGEPLDELFEKIGAQPDGASEKIFASGMLEWRRSHRQDGGLIAGAQARIAAEDEKRRDLQAGKLSLDLYDLRARLAAKGFEYR